ncbi:ester cyclase [candidate division KSB1 bacterium]|nr:ester cyclase [candidate division KSB1 bacterium]
MSDQELINAAKAPTVAYNKKDWDGVKAAITAGFVYDEVATQSKAAGADQMIEAWRGWATALPDSNATFESAFVSGGKVVLEMTWRGKHTGPMQSPKGEMPATGKSIEIRACQIVEVEGGKAKSMRHYFDMMTMMQQLGLAG